MSVPVRYVGPSPRGCTRIDALAALAGISSGSKDGCDSSMAAEILVGIHSLQQVNIN